LIDLIGFVVGSVGRMWQTESEEVRQRRRVMQSQQQQQQQQQQSQERLFRDVGVLVRAASE